MKTMVAALCLVAGLSYVSADELKSGLQSGAQIGAFEVVKHSGAPDDGVKMGTQLCYRCKYGSSPMVMVFSRNSGKDMSELLKQVDKMVAEHKDHGLKAFANLLGSKQAELESTAKTMGNGLKHVPVVVPVDFEMGPEGYELSKDAEVTIIVAHKGEVVANHAVAAGKFDAAAVKDIVALIEKSCEKKS